MDSTPTFLELVHREFRLGSGGRVQLLTLVQGCTGFARSVQPFADRALQNLPDMAS